MSIETSRIGSGADCDPTGNRAEARLSVYLHNAKFRESGATGTGVTVEDLSRKGFRTEWPYPLKPGDRVWITLPGLEAKCARVRWTRGFSIGCQFEEPIHQAVFDHLLRRIDAHR